MSNDTEPKKRGHSCCPTDAAIYRAVNDDPRVQPFTGTAREIADRLGHGDNYIRHIARTGVTTKKGWRIELETPGPYTGINNAIPRDYIAERPDDDPIIGPVEEIAALTGMHPSSVEYLIRTGGKSRAGWRVRPVEDDDHGFDINPDTVVE
jgi:hypothetical protein